MVQTTVRIEGLERLQQKMTPAMIAGPVRDFLERSGREVESRAKQKAPVDTGRLRGGITTSVRQTEAVVGVNVTYAPHVEFGTRPHWPPLSAMQPWARRHGFPAGRTGAFLVARRIARHGTPAQPFLLPALNESKGDIEANLRTMAREIEQRWQSG